MDTFRVLSTGDELKEHKMVLQCQTCRTIVGDSNELVCVYTVNHGSDDEEDHEEVQYISIACTCIGSCFCCAMFLLPIHLLNTSQSSQGMFRDPYYNGHYPS